ncbi:MAG: hypothetical protein IH956_08350 [Chloroflexi bacterium]|nr:hypothetical protein [Chloroflexota bacterium]
MGGTAREWRGRLPGDILPGSRLDLRLVMTKFGAPGVRVGYELLLMGP